MARSAGKKTDLRFGPQPYGIYPNLQFKSFITKKGDSFDRYLIRLLEMFESTVIITKALGLNKTVGAKNQIRFTSMEKTIREFKH